MLEMTQVLDRDLPGLDAKARREFFEQIAFWYHEQEQMSVVAKPVEIEAQLQEQIQERLGEVSDIDTKARRLLKTIVERSGLFRENEDRAIQFEHHTFQEYLAARHLAFRPDFVGFVMGKLGNLWWEETIRLAAGHLSTEHNPYARTLLSELIGSIAREGENTDQMGRNCLIAGQCLVDVGPMGVSASLRHQIQAKLEALSANQDYTHIHDQVESVLAHIQPPLSR